MNANLIRNRARGVLNAMKSERRGPSEISDFKSQISDAAAAFESDMRPVCNAIVGALKAGDIHALQGLRALLPHLLEEVNAAPALADVLALQLGKSLITGLKAGPEDAL